MPQPQPEKIDPTKLVELAKKVIKNGKFPMLATVDGDQARVRPVSPVLVDNFTIYVANLRYYQKTAEIAQCPKVELCYMDPEHNQVRITGVAEVLTDKQLLEKIWQKNRLLEHYLGTIDNPDLIIYKIIPTKVSYMQEWALKYWEVAI